MADVAPFPIWIARPDTRYAWFNKAWLALSGRHLAEEIGNGWRSKIHPEDLSACMAAHLKACATRSPFEVEYRLLDNEGNYRRLRANGVPVFSPEGSFTGHVGSCIDLTAQQAVEDALHEAHDRLKRMAAQRERTREEERKRIAREIHDDLGQNLLALRLDIAMLQARTAETHPGLNSRANAALMQLDASIKAMRATISKLRPPIPGLSDLGLLAMIERQLDEFQQRTGIACSLNVDASGAPLDEAVATALIRLLQESLSNVWRHARAKRIDVALSRKGRMLRMSVTDDGIGLAPDACRKADSFGLLGMEERAQALSGNLTIHSVSGQGTTVVVSIPLD